MNSNIKFKKPELLSVSREWGMWYYNLLKSQMLLPQQKSEALCMLFQFRTYFFQVHGVFVQEKSWNIWEFRLSCSLTLLGMMLALEHLSSITDILQRRKIFCDQVSICCICHGVHRLQFHFNRRETTYFTCKRIPSSAPRERDFPLLLF